MVFPAMGQNVTSGSPLRVWSPGGGGGGQVWPCGPEPWGEYLRGVGAG